MQPPSDQAGVIRSESERLVKYLESLPADGWYRPTDLEQWQVRDIVVHLTERAIGFYPETMALGVKGDVSEPPGFNLQGLTEYVDGRRNIAERAIARRADDADTMVAQLQSRSEQFCTLLAGLKPEDMDKPCWVTNGTRAVWELGPIIIQEVAIHSWDIRSMFESWPSLGSESLSALKQRIVEVMTSPARLLHSPGFSVGSSATNPVRYRLVLNDQSSETHDLILHERRVRIKDSVHSRADVTLECESETFVLVFYKRVTVDEAIVKGRLVASGEEQLVSDFNSWLNDVKIAGLH